MEHTSHATKRAAHQPPSLTNLGVLAIKDYFPLHSYLNKEVRRLLDNKDKTERTRRQRDGGNRRL